jgi:ATP-dependent Clp protease ATP-binding subunit ClpA
MYKIVDRLVVETNNLLEENESTVTISITDACREKLAQDGYQPSMGARPLKRVFEDNVKKPLSKKILFEDLTNTNIVIDVDGEEYKFVV